MRSQIGTYPTNLTAWGFLTFLIAIVGVPVYLIQRANAVAARPARATTPLPPPPPPLGAAGQVPAARFCLSCGAEFGAAGARFCGSCGTPRG